VDRKRGAAHVIKKLLNDGASPVEPVGRESEKVTKVRVLVSYANPRSAKALPNPMVLLKPTEEGCKQLRKLFADTLDTRVILLACLPNSIRSESFLSQLTVDSRSKLTNKALDLVLPDWRSLAAGASPSQS
jgi:hypothetical protein